MVLEEIKIVRKQSADADRTIIFRCVHNFICNKNQQVISIPLVNQAASNNALFRLFGQVENISFDFVLYFDGEDVSDGDNITTINQQILWIRDYIYTAEFDTSWQLTFLALGGRYYPTAVTVVITDVEIDEDRGQINAITGHIAMKRGTLGALG